MGQYILYLFLFKTITSCRQSAKDFVHTFRVFSGSQRFKNIIFRNAVIEFIDIYINCNVTGTLTPSGIQLQITANSIHFKMDLLQRVPALRINSISGMGFLFINFKPWILFHTNMHRK